MSKPRHDDFSTLTIANDFLFGKVMLDKELCLGLLRRIFPTFEILDIDYPAAQEPIKNYIDAKGIRLDLRVKESTGERVYNLEMQTTHKRDMRRRGRYYLAQMDTGLILQGQKYKELPQLFVIFICTFDPFKQGRHVYTFHRVCIEDKELELGDETTLLFLNAQGKLNDCTPELKEFLDYTKTGEPTEDDFIKQVHEAVIKARRNSDWGREYMNLLAMREDDYDDGREDGIIEGETRAINAMIENMKAQGIALEMISKISGKTVEYIANLTPYAP